MMKIERVISCVAATRTEDNASRVGQMIEGLRLVLEEIQALDPLHTPTANYFVKRGYQLQQLTDKFTFATVAA